MAKRKKLEPQQIRQGDCLLLPVTEHPELADKPERDPRGVVLADGEQSQHYHHVVGHGAKLFRFRDVSSDRLLVVGRGGAEVRVVGGGTGGGAVDRHALVQIGAGKYIRRTQREWSIAQERAFNSPD